MDQRHKRAKFTAMLRVNSLASIFHSCNKARVISSICRRMFWSKISRLVFCDGLKLIMESKSISSLSESKPALQRSFCKLPSLRRRCSPSTCPSPLADRTLRLTSTTTLMYPFKSSATFRVNFFTDNKQHKS